MPGAVSIPSNVRAALGLPQRGHLPRKIRYRQAFDDAERRLVEALPHALERLIGCLDAADVTLRADTARYIVDRLYGRPAPAAVAPADDTTLPQGNDRVALIASAFQGLPVSTVEAIRALVASALSQQGQPVTPNDVTLPNDGTSPSPAAEPPATDDASDDG